MNVDLRSDHLNIISLCTGGYGLDHAVELAIPAARTVCMVEREAYACATLVSAMEAGLLARSPIWSDARTFDGRAWRGAVDGLIGGIPCQPHSLAGKRLGRDDARDLWSIARRIFVQSGAWFIVIENVRGMLSSGGAERVRRDLQRLGCEVEGGLFTASEVGASHERERLFILAVADNAFRRRGHLGASRECNEPAREDRGRSSSLADGIGSRLEGCEPSEVARPGNQGAAAQRVCSVVDDASIARGGRLPVQPRRQDKTGGDSDRAGEPMDDAVSVGRTARRNNHRGNDRHQLGAASAVHLFPPGPNDRKNWQAALERAPELEPAFRRVADGLASRLDIGRVDRLRLLGNGVLPLEGAYALRTLAPRLAARGSAGAAWLVRLMEAA